MQVYSRAYWLLTVQKLEAWLIYTTRWQQWNIVQLSRCRTLLNSCNPRSHHCQRANKWPWYLLTAKMVPYCVGRQWCTYSCVYIPRRVTLKPGFHYPSWRPVLTARVDRWPVSITRQHGPCWWPVNSTSGNARPSTRPVLTGNGNRSPVNSGRQLG